MHYRRWLTGVLLAFTVLTAAEAGEVEVIPLLDEQPAAAAPSLSRLAENERKLWLARRLFRGRDYATAERVCRDILLSDPENRHARVLSMQCLDIMRTSERKLKARAEEIREEAAIDRVVEESRVPDKPVLIPRPELQLRGRTPRSAQELRMEEMLNQRISLNFINVDLDYLLNTLFKITGVNIIADQSVIEGKSLTVHVEDMPLKSLLDFITRVHSDLSYTATPEAVWMVSSDKSILEPRIYPLNTGLVAFGNMSLTGGSNRAGAGGAGGITSAQGVSAAITQAVSGGTGGGGSSYLEEVLTWVSGWADLWPPDSQYYIDRKTNSLMVITTSEMHKRLEGILDVIDRPPVQVLIRTKFVEVTTNNIRDLGFNIAIPSDTSTTSTASTTTPPAGSLTPPTPFEVDTSRKYNWNSGTGTILGVGKGDGLNLLFSGFGTEPQFQAMLRAFEKDARAKLLSAPQILALNNQQAIINVSTTFSVVQGFKEVSTTTVVDGTTTSAPSVLVPSETRDYEVGFRLEVTPSVGHDLKTITLELHPLVDDVEGGTDRFQQFDIISADTSNGGVQTIPTPIIKTREIITRLIIEDGGVVVLGGLMRNRTERVIKRVPILGYLPLIGLLFRSQSDTVERSNLFIIVQANIVTPSGAQYADLEKRLPAAESALRIESGSPEGWIFDYTPDTERQINRTLYPAVGR